MTQFLLLAGAAALAATSPLAAKPGQGQTHGQTGHAKVMKAQTVKAAKVKTARVKSAKVAKVKTPKRIWTTACPSGLAWRGTVCVPPGHANRLLNVGTRVPRGWSYTPWGAVPNDLRTTYALDPNYRYVYRDGVIYVVDPQTSLISSIINAVL